MLWQNFHLKTKGVQMKYIWMILLIIMLAGVGMAYIFTNVFDYFFPKRSQTEIIVQSPSGMQ